MTRDACEFILPLIFRALSGTYVIVDDYSPDNPDPIAHITFSQTIDLFVIAPATANTLAKLANGVADDFITSTYLACTAPVLVAPAMNTVMWQHPATRRNIDKLRRDGVHIIEPDAGEMACGTIGPGRLSAPERIVTAALDMLGEQGIPKDLAGERILITVGATREEIDPVRFISNRSSGRMGFALAEAAKERGAEVIVIAGFTTVEPPANVSFLRAQSAAEMHAAVMDEIKEASVFIAAAAVSDYRPVNCAPKKIKKLDHRLELSLERTEDILSDVAAMRDANQLIVGFAAETTNVVHNAREKLINKKLDLLIANDVTQNGAGFDVPTNIITIISRDSDKITELPLMSKPDAAHRILDEVVRLRSLERNSVSAKSQGSI